MKKIIFFTFFCLANICFFNSFAQPCPLITATGFNDVCMGSTLGITITYGSGSGTESWSSSNTGVLTVASSGAGTGAATITPVAPGSAVVRYLISGVVQCTKNIIVRALPTPGTISTSGTFDVCVGSNITVTSSGDPGGVWTSSNTSEATVGASSGVVTGVGAGTPDVTYTVTNVYGCTDDTWQAVNVHALPTVTITSGPSNVCHTGTPTATITATPSLGSWSASNANASVGAFTGVVTGANAGPVNISYHYTDANNCTDYAVHPMTVDPTPNAGTLSGTFHTWPGLITTLTSSGQTGGSWGTAAAGIATVAAGGSPGTGDVTGVSAGFTNITYVITNTCGTNNTYKEVTVYPFPTMPVNTIYTDPNGPYTSGFGGFNTAMIYTTKTASPYNGASGHDFIYAFASWDGSSAGTVSVVDHANYTTQYAMASLTEVPINTPDVVIANYPGAVGVNPDKYLVAVAYPTTGGKVMVEIFEYDLGNPTSLSAYATQYDGTYAPDMVRIDVMTNYASTGVTGYPYCQHAAVVWRDATSGQVFVQETDLQSTGSTFTGSPVGLDYGENPDVAGIYRNVGGSHRVALVASSGGDIYSAYYKLYYTEYDFGAAAVARQATLDSSLYPYLPRIDANDNEGTNDTSLSQAYFKIAASTGSASPGREIHTFDNLLYYPAQALDYWTSSNVVAMPPGSSYPAPPYDHLSPSVAMVGPNSGGSDPDGTAYMVTHMTNDGGGDEVMFAEIIGNTASTALAGGVYYWVSDDPPMASPAGMMSASAPTCNRVDEAAIAAWYDGNTNDIKYQISMCCYGFKQGEGPEGHGTKAVAAKGWQLYPNPAGDQIIISNAEGAGSNYSISDVLGRTQRSGTIAGSATEVNVGRLAPGTYVLRITGAKGESVVKKFVKQ